MDINISNQQDKQLTVQGKQDIKYFMVDPIPFLLGDI